MPGKDNRLNDFGEEEEDKIASLGDEKFEASLLERRIILLTGEITHEKAGKIKGSLAELSILSPKEKIFLFINSIGGQAEAAFALYDFMTMFLKAPVVGIVSAECLSAALVVLQGCKKRVAVLHSSFSIHSIRWTGWGVYTPPIMRKHMKRLENGMKETFQVYTAILSRHSKVSLSEIKKLALMNDGDGVDLSAPEALEKGFIDEIAEGDKYKIF